MHHAVVTTDPFNMNFLKTKYQISHPYKTTGRSDLSCFI